MLIKVLTVALIVVLVLAIIYLLCIMPRMVGRPDYKPFKELMYAHRGLHDNESDAPENSMAAFRKAVEGGYGMELDVQLSKDGVPVIFHDFTLERMARMEVDASVEGTVTVDGAEVNLLGKTVVPAKGKVSDYTFEELQQFTLGKSGEKIPTFKELLEMVDGKTPLIIEYKIPGVANVKVCELCNEMLKEYKGLYCIESFNPFAVLWYRRHNKKVLRGQLSDSYIKEKQTGYPKILFFILHHLMLNFLAKPDFIAYNHFYYKDVSRRLCRYLYGGLAAAYTIKSQQQLEDRSGDFDMFIFDSFIPKDGNKNVAK